jgi:hypothetical protein
MINWQKGIFRLLIILQSLISVVVICLFIYNYLSLPDYSFVDDVGIVLETNLQSKEIFEVKQEYEAFIKKREPEPADLLFIDIDFTEYISTLPKYSKLISEIINNNVELLKIRREKQNPIREEKYNLIRQNMVLLVMVWTIPLILLWASLWIIKGFRKPPS